jgi:hypothetical protein
MNNLTFSEQKALVAQTYSAAGDARGAVGDLLNALENVDFEAAITALADSIIKQLDPASRGLLKNDPAGYLGGEYADSPRSRAYRRA